MSETYSDEDPAIQRLRRDMVRVARKAVEMGLQKYFGGNLSVRLGAQVAGAGTYLVKRSGASFASCRPSDFMEVDSDGRPVSGQERPTKEIRFHLGIYSARSDVNAVVHVHPPWSIAAGEVFEVFPLCTDQARTRLEVVPLVRPSPAGSVTLAEDVVSAFRDPRVRAAILRQHGVVCVGNDLHQAQELAELLEESSQVAVLISLARRGSAWEPASKAGLRQ